MTLPKENLAHPCFPQPADPTVRVWRYMDFPKLVWALTHNALVLTRVDTLDDKREGRHGKHFFHAVFLSTLRQMELTDIPPSHAERERLATQVAELALHSEERNRAASFVSCWCMGGDKESEAMWQIYAGRGASVALVLPYERLRDSLKGTDLLVGTVTYFDFNRGVVSEGNVFRATMCKGHEYEHENEVRIVKHVPSIWSGDKVPPGVPSISDPPRVMMVPWVIADHVERIVISPHARSWQADAIRAVVRRLHPGLEDRIVGSEMT
jgi:hypothetical protein